MAAIKGGCMCGRYRYEASEASIVSGACYCRECQYSSGGAPAFAILMIKTSVKVTPAMPRAWNGTSARGNQIARYFCEECGTPLFAESSANPTLLSIKVGSLDDPSGFKSTGSIWVSSAQPWHYIDPALPRFERDPA